MQTSATTSVFCWRVLLPLCMITLLTASGCIGASAQLMYVLFGHKTKAEFDGLKGKRVAIVSMSDADSYGPDPLGEVISRAMTMRLVQNVRKVDMIPQGEIEDWMDANGWGNIDFKELGTGVEADVVIVIELSDYDIHDGATLYKGQSSYRVEVYDMEDEGRLVFTRGPESFVFPRDGRPSIEHKEHEFERFYLAHLTDHLARYFYPFDSTETAAIDSALMH